MDKHQHRGVFNFSGGLPHVEIETVLAHVRQPVVLQGDFEIVINGDVGQGVEHRVGSALHGHGGEVVAVSYALPGQRVLRRLPAQFAHRRRGKGDTGIYLHRTIAVVYAPELPFRHGDNAGLFRRFSFHRRHRPDGRLKKAEHAGEHQQKNQSPSQSGKKPCLTEKGPVQNDIGAKSPCRRQPAGQRDLFSGVLGAELTAGMGSECCHFIVVLSLFLQIQPIIIHAAAMLCKMPDPLRDNIFVPDRL